MEYMIIGLLLFAVLLLLVSFFRKDKLNEIEEQVDQLSLTLMHETYQLKKKMKILEEELLINEQEIPKPISPIRDENEYILTQIEKGMAFDQIAKESGLPTEEVRLLAERAKRQSNGL
ncbi:hypothetical protein IMZ08_07925 [Bacillus luteolus]|uniref:DUF2802 domain-containing protein n=1 Tax=Litchfieldia luteola TaxID=682179 RepID=A0ABR9QHK7_9BACI|nr:hypothetical protein [Cytobacillus luteolus]MBE4907977.1 hypothetical protein [Cytobacillus luteolus]MBP1942759.1 hypothetical protein [Cytobacillus luteolus]